MSDPLILEHHDLVSVLTFNNPPAHTWTPESLQQLQQIVADLNSNANNRALVVTGAGDKFFSAGADLQRFHHRDTCLLYTSPSPRDLTTSRMPSSA